MEAKDILIESYDLAKKEVKKDKGKSFLQKFNSSQKDNIIKIVNENFK